MSAKLNFDSRWVWAPILAALLLLVSVAVLAKSEGVSAQQSFSQLADVIENDDSRARLVELLRQAQTPDAATALPQPAIETPANAGKQDKTVTLGMRMNSWAYRTTHRIAHIQHQAQALWQWFTNNYEASLEPSQSLEQHGVLASLALLAVIAVIILFALQIIVIQPIFNRLAKWANINNVSALLLFVRRSSAIVLAFITDLVGIFIAATLGYIVVESALSEALLVPRVMALLINAFIGVEVCKAVVRLVLSSRYESLRIVNIPASIAGWWSIRARWLVGLVGYSLLVLVPVLAADVNAVLAQLLAVMTVMAAYVYIVQLLLGTRDILTQRLLVRANGSIMRFFAVVYRVVAKTWLPVSLVYISVVLVAWLASSERVFVSIMAGSAQIVVSGFIAMGVAAILQHWLRQPSKISARLAQKLPQLSVRVQRYKLVLVRLLLTLTLAAFGLTVIDALGLFNVRQWLAMPQGQAFVAMLIHIAIILGLAGGSWLVSSGLLKLHLSGGFNMTPSARQATLVKLLLNALAITIVTLTTLVVLSQIGVNIGPLLAGAGVLGLAIGFGAQSLVKDVINGLFIQLENAMNEGDVVTMAGLTGKVEKLTIRSVCIRDRSGVLHTVPYSSASIVSNFMRNFGVHNYDYRISYDSDVELAINEMLEAFEQLKQDEALAPLILEEMPRPKVVDLSENAVKVRAAIRTLPGQQWGVGHAYHRLVKDRFARAGIVIPVQQQMLQWAPGHEPKQA